MTQIDACGILEIAMAGTSATLLARKWESALLVNVHNHIESFNGKFRHECLNEQWFETLHQTRRTLAPDQAYHRELAAGLQRGQAHSSLGRIPPAQFADVASPAHWRCKAIVFNHHADPLTLQPRTSSIQ